MHGVPFMVITGTATLAMVKQITQEYNKLRR